MSAATLSNMANATDRGQASRGAAQAFVSQLDLGARFECDEDRLGMIGRDLIERPQLRADIVMHHVGAEQAQCRERARPRWHQDARDAKL